MTRLRAAACILAAAALGMPAVPAHAASVLPGWEVFCFFSHRLNDDPIVMPGMPGMAMRHDFFANEQSDAFSTPATLRSASSTSNCELTADKASYWVPTLYSSGVVIPPKRLHSYYRWGNITNFAAIQPISYATRMIVGDASGQTPIDTAHIGWSCGAQGEALTAAPTDCRAKPLAEMVLHFFYPNCQINADPTKPSSFTWSHNGACASGTPIVRLSEDFAWPAKDPATLKFSTGVGTLGSMQTAHSDFMNGWPTSLMATLTHDCVNAGRQCGPIKDGDPIP